MIDNRTSNYNFALPNQGNTLLEDVGRLISALSAVDGQILLKQTASQKGLPNGYAGLNAQGVVPAAQLPAPGTTDSIQEGTVNLYLTEDRVLALVPKPGCYTYDNRGTLRSQTPIENSYCFVIGLGLFVWQAGTLIDDDETCFNTATGAWTLVAASPDYTYSAIFNDVLAVSEKVFFGTFFMSLTSLAAVTSSDITCSVTGAVVGDRVLVTPGNSFGTSNSDKPRLSYVAWVSAQDTVTVSLRNASASTAFMKASTWSVAVFKS